MLTVIAAALWGYGAGMLIPRAAYRLSVEPEQPWRATCPAGHPLTGAGNGWLGRARCADGTSYGPSTPVVASATALVCALLAATGTQPELGIWLLLAPIGVLLAVVDIAVHRLPDVVTLPLAPITLGLLGVAALLSDTGGRWTTALLASLGLGAAYFMLFLAQPKGVGFGDVKLALSLGAVLGWYGWAVLFVGTFTGFLLAALYGIALVLGRRAGLKTAIPLCPCLLVGTFTGVFLGSVAQ